MKKGSRIKAKMSAVPRTLKCPECNYINPNNALFCCSCGHYIGKTIMCKNCEKSIPLNSDFCCYCGEKLKSIGQLSDLWIEKQLTNSISLSHHPIMNADKAIRKMYFRSLKSLVDKEISKNYLLPEERCFPEARLKYYRSKFCGKNAKFSRSIDDLLHEDCRKILGIDRENYQRPYSVIVTATMSAGKSTFLNALAGKKISSVKSMACTSRIHEIISKPSEDGIVSKYDQTLIFDADETQLMSSDEKTTEDVIGVGTYLNGRLGGKSIVLLDTPGINAYGHSDHRDITRKVIGSGDGDLILYIINASQSTTFDNAQHLRYIKETIGDRRILFVVNKIDTLRPEEDTTPEKLCELIRDDIIRVGFSEPVICPVSARVAFVEKMSHSNSDSFTDEMKLELYVARFFFESQSLNKYYSEAFPEIARNNVRRDDLIYKCGMGWIEDIINSYISQKAATSVL